MVVRRRYLQRQLSTRRNLLTNGRHQIVRSQPVLLVLYIQPDLLFDQIFLRQLKNRWHRDVTAHSAQHPPLVRLRVTERNHGVLSLDRSGQFAGHGLNNEHHDNSHML